MAQRQLLVAARVAPLTGVVAGLERSATAGAVAVDRFAAEFRNGFETRQEATGKSMASDRRARLLQVGANPGTAGVTTRLMVWRVGFDWCFAEFALGVGALQLDNLISGREPRVVPSHVMAA